MRNASSALIALLNNMGPTSPLYIADLLTIQWPQTYTNLAGGPFPSSAWPVVARLTSANTTLQSTSQALSPSDVNIYTFAGGSPTFVSGQAHWNIGLEVDDMPVTIYADPLNDILAGQSWPSAVRNGFLDGALITLERLFMPTWGDTSAGTIIRFKGFAADVLATRSSVQMTVHAITSRLEDPMPRNLWQVPCVHMLFDQGCTLLKATFTKTGACTAGTTTKLIFTNTTDPVHYYDQGTIVFTSGVNNGLSRGVYSYTSAHVANLDMPLPVAPAVGDTFTIVPGCDKTPFTCNSRYSNIANFGGQPNIPVPETAT